MRAGAVCLTASVIGLALATPVGASNLDPVGPPFVIATGVNAGWVGGNPAVAYDGTNFLAVWKGPSSTVQGARISPDGLVLDSPPLALGSNIGSSATPAVGFDGTRYLVVWAGGEILARRVNTDGTLPDASPIQVTTGGSPKDRRISIAFDGTNYLLAWRNYTDQIRAARVAPDGGIVDGPAGIRLGTGFYPWAAFDGTNYLVVWHYWGNSLDVFGNRVTTAGNVLDGSGFVISAAGEDQEHASVASDGINFLVVWTDVRGGDSTGYSDDSARGTRVSAAGSVLDDPEILIGERHCGPEHVSVTFDGTDYVVIWMPDHQADYRLTDVHGRQVSGIDGAPSDARIPVASSHGHQWAPRFGCGGDRCLVIWGETNSFRCTGCVLGQILERVPTKSTDGPGSFQDSSLDDLSAADACPPPLGVWEAVTSPTTGNLYEVEGVSENEVYAVGENTPLYSFNGTGWSQLASAPTAPNFGLWAGGPEDVATLGWCWVLGWWDGQETDHSGCHTDFPSNEYGIGMGLWEEAPGTFLTVGTEGHSQLWDEGTGMGDAPVTPTGVPFDLWDMWRSPAGPLYAVGEQGTILFYDDGVWSATLDVPTSHSLNAIWGRAADDIYAVGDFGTILHHNGASWSVQQSGAGEHLFGVGGSSSIVYAVGTGGTILSFNGECWQPEASGTDRPLMDVTMGGGAAWIVGIDGTILRKKSAAIFADGFESGDTLAWSSTVP